MNNLTLQGFRFCTSRRGRRYYILNFVPSNADLWIGQCGHVVYVLDHDVIGNISVGSEYKIVTRDTGNFAAAVIERV